MKSEDIRTFADMAEYHRQQAYGWGVTTVVMGILTLVFALTLIFLFV